MLLMAMIVARWRRTSLDSCDSWLLQLQHRKAVGARTLPIRLGLMLMRLPNRLLENSYISRRDAQVDLFGSVPAIVIPQSAPKILSSLPPMSGAPDRIVIAADFESFHNLEGARNVFASMDIFTERHPKIRVQLFGRIPAGFEIPSGIEVRGWVDDIADVYAGNTAVVITNRAGSGVPNKVVEAMAARRPMFIHSSLDYLELDGADARVYTNSEDLLDELEGIVEIQS